MPIFFENDAQMIKNTCNNCHLINAKSKKLLENLFFEKHVFIYGFTMFFEGLGSQKSINNQSKINHKSILGKVMQN